MLILREFFKTQSDSDIHQNAPTAPYFRNFLGAAYAPEPHIVYAGNYNINNIIST